MWKNNLEIVLSSCECEILLANNQISCKAFFFSHDDGQYARKTDEPLVLGDAQIEIG